ncbi:MAG TPA: M1 family metallopeptidase [Gemmatimonadaceae bacterium]|nr:M1 family metallopeptidase [Gemmatimonadaceae bacterium]
MPIWPNVALAIALQQGPPVSPGYSTPPGGDTVGYWQQRVTYTITATLDERAGRLHARGILGYVNNSPDTLREMYVHQYLNAFRPGSKWSQVDEREGRDRFQHLAEPDYGYERFTAPVRVNGTAVTVDYPGAPDSTVARFRLPAPLAPGDSLAVVFEWDARPSTIPRRQGRRGRHWDLAQWYPKVAVYDRGGWEYNALQPAGEFYGEFGTYDVTLVVAEDQIIGATGVPVSGDPGYSRAIREGVARTAADAYGDVPPAPDVSVGSGQRAVRFYARDVHHFAWSTSPDYRYEGGIYVRRTPSRGPRPAGFDTVSIHVLYRQGDDTTWGKLKVVERTAAALQWLELIYGRYAYPQMTVLHRLDGGGTEFPMMQMNGSPSQGLILHEGGHVFTYGILANNEWRSGWMDEGLTSYQTDWAQGLTAQEFARAGLVAQRPVTKGYGGRALRMALPRFEATALDQAETDLRGDAEPIGTWAQGFRDFSVYNDMIYTRAQVMYSQLRDVLGDSLFVEFLHDYYARWALKHVDERAMRGSAERVSGRNLGWFFDQWVHHTGVMDYRLAGVASRRDAAGAWTTEATVIRRGQYRHPVAVGVRTAQGWTLARGADTVDRQVVRITTPDRPLEVRLDPFHFSWDWDRRNDVEGNARFLRLARARWAFDWPFLEQSDRGHDVALLSPALWYSNFGLGTYGLRTRLSYLGWLDKSSLGIAVPQRQSSLDPGEIVQLWWRVENPYIGRRPAIGWRAGLGLLDGIGQANLGWEHQTTSARRTAWFGLALTGAFPTLGPLLPELWSAQNSGDLTLASRWTLGPTRASHWFINPTVVLGVADEGYGKAELAAGRIFVPSDVVRVGLRAFGATEWQTPPQRALYVSAKDPLSTYDNNWWRPAGAILKRPGVDWLPLGGGALRGYDWRIASDDYLYGGNVDASVRLAQFNPTFGAMTFALHGFGDFGNGKGFDTLGDAGVGISVRGRLFDKPVFLRVDSPFYVSEPALALDRGRAGSGEVAPRWAITFADIW